MIGTIATADTTGEAIFSEVSSVETIIAIVTRTGMAVAETEMIVGTIITVTIGTIVVVAAVTTDIADGAITTVGKTAAAYLGRVTTSRRATRPETQRRRRGDTSIES